jgi:PAS domain S-box-containing protein
MQLHQKVAAMVTHEPGTLGTASEQQFRRLANAMPQIVWISDPAGRTEYLNDYWYQFSGIERTGAGCESWLAAVHTDDEQVCREAWRSAIQSGLPFEAECRFWNRSSGTHHWFLGRAAPSRGDDGTVLCWFGTATDIDDFKRAQTEIRALNLDLEKRVGERTAELFESEQRLKLTVENVRDYAIYMLGCDGRIATWNIGAERLKGYTAAEVVGRHISIFYRDEDVTNGLPQRELEIALEKGQFHEEGQRIRKDGSVFWASVLITPVYGATGELRGFSKIVQDVTQLKKAIEAAREACERAENANRAKSDFLARMSHEIRTPMNLIMGMNALLLEDNLDARQRKHVEISYRNVRRLLRLINTILDLSKVEAGMLTLEVAPFDLNEVLSESVATLSAAVEQKGLRLSLDVASGIWPYRQGDPERLQQVLMNLLGNAIKFTAEGSIHLRARPAEGSAGGECLRFEVSDTGCGVPKGQEETIFKAFQQADGAMNRTHEGTGLGLSITKSLVELMGGRIWVELKEDPGTQLVFTVCLPRATKHAVNSHTEKSRTVTKARGLKPGTRILIAEDNEENLFLLQSYLKGQSAIVEIAANGVEAVQKRQENHYDVILMDIQMPLMDGLAATRVIRAWEAKHESARMPIVALTAHALSGAAAECREAGCDGYLSKPVQRGDLMQTIIRFSASAEVPSNAAGGQAQPTSSPGDAGIRALRPRYLANRANDIKAMRAALEICDFSAIKRIAHDSKGTGTGYGFPEISALSKVLENAAIQSDAAGVAARIAEMEKLVSSSAE